MDCKKSAVDWQFRNADMRTATARLAGILDSQQFVKCNLFTLTLVSGTSYYWTDADVDIVAHNQIYDSSGPSISGAKYSLIRGLQVSSLDLTVVVKPTDYLDGAPWLLATRSGALKNAVVSIDKAFMPAWGDVAETLNIFTGYVDESNDGEQVVTLTVVSDANRLNMKVPREVFQAGCMRTLFDNGCKVLRDAYSVEGAVVAAPNRYSFNVNLAQPDDYFSLGEITFLNGVNAGVRRAVKSYASGVVTLSSPVVIDLAVGDAFIIRAGCDKTRGANGCARFANEVNFKGTPYIPPPESSL